jgi:hypothetical protein
MFRRFVRRATALSAVPVLALAAPLSAQGPGVGGSVTPYAGYLVPGAFVNGPVGTDIRTASAPVVGAQLAIPLVAGLSLTGSVGYASADLRVGLPVLGGVSVGRNQLWLYDAGLELGGLARGRTGLAPFVQAGVGGMSNNVRNRFLDVQSTNLVYTGGVGVDLGFSRQVALRVQAKDYIGRFDTQEAVGLGSRGDLTHNWALSAGLKLAF